MFTGIIEATGIVRSLSPQSAAPELGARLELAVPLAIADLALGDSLAVNGCCLTVAEIGQSDAATQCYHFDLLSETLRATNLGSLAPGRLVNLERALAVNARLGGHFVQGHVDATGTITEYEPEGDNFRLSIHFPAQFQNYVISRGSVAIDGMSLTAARINDISSELTIWITPHTHSATNLSVTEIGRCVNLEFDLLAKYVERLFAKSENLQGQQN